MARKIYTDADIRRAIRLAKGNPVRAAKRLGCAPSTVYCRGHRLGLAVQSPPHKPKRIPSDVEDAALWNAFASGSRDAAETIAAKYVPLARRLVDRVKMSVPQSVTYDDLFGAALEGLLEAMRIFDPERGVHFATYAPPRIRGAVLDELRRIDHAPRSGRKVRHQYDAVRTQLAHNYGRSPTHDEVCEAIGWDVEQARKAELAQIDSLDAVWVESDNGRQTTYQDLILVAPERDQRAIDHVEQITRGIGFEPRVILWMYFAIGRQQQEIGQFLGLSPSRVSQLIAIGLEELRKQPRLAEEYGKRIEDAQHG